MAINKQRKAQLDRYTLEFNKWATIIIDQVTNKYPKAHISIWFLMQCYCAGINKTYVKKQLISDHHLRTGE